MTRIASQLLIISMIASTSSPLFAVSWDELRSSAVNNILPLRAANQSVERADAATSEAKAGFLPTLKASANAARSIDPEPTGAINSNRVGVTASQNLFSGFSDQKSVEKAEASKTSAVAARNNESVNQRSVLRKIFNNGLYQQQLLELSKQIVARREQNVRIVNLRYSSGLENKSSFLRVQASQMQAEADRDLTAARYASAKIDAGRRSGRNLSENDRFDGDLAKDASSTQPQGPHPTIMKAQADRDAASSNVAVTRAGWLPQLSADASAYRSGDDFKLDSQNHYQVGLTLTVPLFTPTQSPQYREATSDLTKAEISLASAQLEYDLTLKNAKIVVDDAKRRVNIAQKTFEATEMQAEVYRKRYTLGLISFQDWDSAETDFINANREYLTTQQKLADAVADLDSAEGRKLEDEGP